MTAITSMRIGEALVSMLDAQGSPMPVERALIYPPHSRMTPLTTEERSQVIRTSSFLATYKAVIDRESAYEQLKKKTEIAPAAKVPDVPAKKSQRTAGSRAGDVIGSAATSAAHAIGSQIGRELMRGLLGSLTGTRKK
jgi:DNA helicase HerA-like ATPase